MFTPNESIATTATNQMDCWLIASLQTLIKTVHVEVGENYMLYNVAPPLVQYLEQITNWYLRLNRDRLKGDGGEKDWHDALSTTYTVLLNMCIGAHARPSPRNCLGRFCSKQRALQQWRPSRRSSSTTCSRCAPFSASPHHLPCARLTLMTESSEITMSEILIQKLSRLPV